MLRVEGVPAGGAAWTFDVPDGRCVGLLSADATALAHISDVISGLRPTTAGSILIDGWDSVRDGARVRMLVSVCLPRAADHRATVLDHVGAIARARGAVREPVADGLARLGLSPNTRLTTVAAKAGAALAAALIARASVIVLNEPFRGLSDDTRTRAIDWIRSLSSAPVSIVIAGSEERDVRAVSHHVITPGVGR